MEKSKVVKNNGLTERMVRNESIFCSLLFDQRNRTLRVIDFRGGNFQSKHAYLERVLISEGMRKIFTLIERDDMNGWQRVGYQREGSIPGYYKRSDAYIMSKVYDDDYEPDKAGGEESAENKKLLADIKNVAKEIADQKAPNISVRLVSEEEAIEAIKAEHARLETKNKAAKKSKSKAKGKDKKAALPAAISDLSAYPPIFPQFSREVDFHYFVAQNRRTKQANIIGAEYQDCFGNAKVELYFPSENRPDQSLARYGLMTAIDKLMEMGAVSIFATTRTDDLVLNAIYASAGFRNTGWMNRQWITQDGPVDLILWTRKLI